MSAFTIAIDTGARVLRRAGPLVAGLGLACSLGAACVPVAEAASPALCKATSWNYGLGHLGVEISCQRNYGDGESVLGINAAQGAFETPLIEANEPMLFVSDPVRKRGIPGNVLLCRRGRHSLRRWGCEPSRRRGVWQSELVSGGSVADYHGPRKFGFVVGVKRPVCDGSRKLILHVRFELAYETASSGPSEGGELEQLTVTPPCTVR